MDKIKYILHRLFWVFIISMIAGAIIQFARYHIYEKKVFDVPDEHIFVDNSPSREIKILTMKLPEPDIEEEIRLGEMEMVSLLCQAEAGNQDLDWIRLVADVILNRVDSSRFPDSVEEVIYQDSQFGPMADGAYEKAGWTIGEKVFQAVEMEWERENRLDQNVLYFNTEPTNGNNVFQHGGHWFGY